jgi:hypothetical protein
MTADQQRRDYERACAVKNRYAGSIMGHEGVTGVGVGGCGDLLVVRVYLRNPDVVYRPPAELDGVPVQVMFTGLVSAGWGIEEDIAP